MKKLRELFYQWAFLDINHTGSYKKTFFGIFEDDNCMTNQEMVSRLSMLLSCVSTGVLLYTVGNNPSSTQFIFHLAALIIFLAFLYMSEMMVFRYSPVLGNTATIVYICFLYAITIADRFFNFGLPDVLFYIVMALTPVAFVLPPVLFFVLSLIWAAVYMFGIAGQLSGQALHEELLAIGMVLAISTLMGWHIGRTRAAQAFANQKSRTLTETLQQTSLTDQLTGLFNHRSFQSDYYSLFHDCQSKKHRFSVIMIDIDKFKLFNDYYGHLEGDRCLSEIGHAIGEYTDEGIVAYRFGGEEFVLLLSGTAASRTLAIAENLRQKVMNLKITHEYSPVASVVTVSVGVHLGVPPAHEKPMDFFDHADQAMYVSKRSGGNRVSVYTEPGQEANTDDED
ncbi:MAG: GGDEF domain-containing protein [Clostridiales bacterium]|nr:GGDEF domain-containing protein [Clostridiales bacterium]